SAHQQAHGGDEGGSRRGPATRSEVSLHAFTAAGRARSTVSRGRNYQPRRRPCTLATSLARGPPGELPTAATGPLGRRPMTGAPLARGRSEPAPQLQLRFVVPGQGLPETPHGLDPPQRLGIVATRRRLIRPAQRCPDDLSVLRLEGVRSITGPHRPLPLLRHPGIDSAPTDLSQAKRSALLPFLADHASHCPKAVNRSAFTTTAAARTTAKAPSPAARRATAASSRIVSSNGIRAGRASRRLARGAAKRPHRTIIAAGASTIITADRSEPSSDAP